MPEYLLLRGQDSWVGARQRDAAAAVSKLLGDAKVGIETRARAKTLRVSNG